MRTLLLQATVLAALALAIGCDETTEIATDVESELGELDSVTLTDADNASIELALHIEQQELSIEEQALLDWSALNTALWSWGDAQPTVDDAASLRHFPGLSLDELTEALANGTLSQADVGLDVSCSSESLSCQLVDFAFDEGHQIDMLSMFAQTEGTWLVTIEKPGSTEPMSYLALVPTTDNAHGVARVTDDSSEGTVITTMAADGPVPVPADGYGLLDWSGLTATSRGQQLYLHRLDRLELAFVPGLNPADAAQDLGQLHAMASEIWTADIEGRASFPIPELVESITGEQGFPGFDGMGEGAWVIGLWATTSGDPAPAFLAMLQPE